MPRQNGGSETGDFRTPTPRSHLRLVSGGVSTPINSPLLAPPNSPALFAAGRNQATPSLFRTSIGIWPSPGINHGSPRIDNQRVPSTPQQPLSKLAIVYASDRQVPAIPTPKSSPWTPNSLRKVPNSPIGIALEKEAIMPKRQEASQQIEDGVVPILDCSISSSAYGGSSFSSSHPTPSQTTEKEAQKKKKRTKRYLNY